MIVRDTAEKNQIERELREFRVQFQAILEGVDDGILACEPDGTIIYANELAAHLLGFDSVAELLATPPAGLSARYEFYDESGRFIPYDRLPSRLAFEGRSTPPSVVRFRKLSAGEERWAILKTVPIKDDQRHVQFVVSIFSDITERRLAEEALRASEARFHAFMDNSPIDAFIKDEGGRFVYVSRPFARLWHKTVEEVVGTLDSTLVPEDVIKRIHEDDREMLSTGRLKEIVELIPTPDGASRFFLTFKFPIMDQSGGQFIGGASVEVTERIKAEEVLQQYAERLQALSRQLMEAQESERKRIARDLHDQIGQALTAIKIDLQIAQHQVSPAGTGSASGSIPGSRSPVPALVERLEQSIETVERTIQQVREFSLDLRPSILDDLGLPSALLWYVEEQCQRAGLRAELAVEQIDTRLPPELEITCFRIAQEAITNVVRHAHATTVAVELRRSHVPQRGEGGGDLVLVIRDDGLGFDPQALSQQTIDDGGKGADRGISRIRGLGLAGMRERMLLVGGRLSIESAPGQGMTVRAVFPASLWAGIKDRSEP